MEMLFVIGGVGLALATAVVTVVVRSRRHRAKNEARVAAEREAQRQVEEARRRADDEVRAATEMEAQRQAEEARIEAEQEAKRQAEDARRRAEEETRAAAEVEAHRQVKEARRRAEEEARVAAEQEAQQREARRRADEQARIAAEQKAKRQAEDARRRAEAEGRAAAEMEAQQREAEEARRRGDEEARAASEQEAQRQAEARRRAELEGRAAAEMEAQRKEATRGRAEEEALVAAEQEAQRREAEEARCRANEEARAAAEQEAHRQAEEASRAEAEARAAAEMEAQQREAEEARRRADEEARAAAEQEAQRQAGEASRAEAEARAAAELKAQRKAEATRRRSEEEARVATEQEAHRREAGEARLRAEEDARAAAEQEAQRQAEEARRRAEEEACVAAEQAPRREGAETRPRAEVRVTGTREDGARAAAATLMETAEAYAPLELGDSGDAVGIVAAPAVTPRTPRQYRPTARAPALPRPPASPTSELASERETRDRAMPIEVRLVFEKAGFCRVSLLPRRAVGMPVEFAVAGSGSPPELLALQDEWYQDVVLPDIGRLLMEGIEWAGALPGGGAGRLSLSGRDIFVLARHRQMNGFVSTPRMVLGEEHVVLCVAERLPDVRAAIALTESAEPNLLNSDSGIPAGWVGLRGVRPRTPVAPGTDGDILDSLRPLPDVELALNGGIRIERHTWLSGFPPSIQLLGDTSTIGVITIDGLEAMRSPDGAYVVPGWDSSGEHTVWCTSTSRTYAIRSGAEEWEPWDAYAWSLGEPNASGTQSRPGICGVLVRPPRVARPDSRPTVVAASNPILIGARPGELEVCTPRGDVRAGLCVGFPWFQPIWASPADALHCDKRTARVLLIGPPIPVDRGDHESSMRGGERGTHRRAQAWGSHAWCAAILAAGRKGLQTEPSRVETADLWKSYKRYAKGLRRAMR